MSEVNAYDSFRAKVRMKGDRIDRIENLVGAGFPDTNCCFDGIEFWMEIKAPIEPVNPDKPLFKSNHPLSQDQMNWFLKQRRAGGLGFVYIETNIRRMLISGKDADIVNTSTVVQLLHIARWKSLIPTPAANWKLLRRHLTLQA